MPWRWDEPEVFLEHNGVTIYHVYKSDEMGQGRRDYWYGTSTRASDDSDEHSFDVRELPAEDREDLNDLSIHEAVIRRAIDDGVIRSTEDE